MKTNTNYFLRYFRDFWMISLGGNEILQNLRITNDIFKNLWNDF